MPYQVTYAPHNNFITLISSGEVTKQELECSQLQLTRMFIDLSLTRLLVDARQRTGLPSASLLFASIADMPAEFKVAILLKEERLNDKNEAFMRHVAVNRGRQLRQFTCDKVAVQWLQN